MSARLEYEKAVELGRRLFWDPRGATSAYGSTNYERLTKGRARTSWSGKIVDPDDPPLLVSQLKSTVAGCKWMLEQWDALKALLDSGGFWQSADKFRAIRLLGRQPMDAADNRDVATIFRFAFVIHQHHKYAFAELRSELFGDEMGYYKQRLSERGLDKCDKDEAEARERSWS